MSDNLARIMTAQPDAIRRATMGGGPTGRTREPGDDLARLLTQPVLPSVQPRPAIDPTSIPRGLWNTLAGNSSPADALMELLGAAIPPMQAGRVGKLGKLAKALSEPAGKWKMKPSDVLEDWHPEARLRSPNHPRLSAWNAAESLKTDAKVSRTDLDDLTDEVTGKLWGDPSAAAAAARAREEAATSLEAARLIMQRLRKR